MKKSEAKCRQDPYGNKMNTHEYFRIIDGNIYYRFCYYIGKERCSIHASSLEKLREKERVILHNYKREGKYISFSLEPESSFKEFLGFFKERLPDTFDMLWEDFIKIRLGEIPENEGNGGK